MKILVTGSNGRIGANLVRRLLRQGHQIRAHAPELHRLVYACTEAVYWRTEDDGRLFERPIREDEVSHSKKMPYFLTKWIGEELCVNYHYQYGLPTVVRRFVTVLEPSELLDAEGIPRNWSVADARAQLQAVPDPTPAAREALQELDAAWQAGTRLLLRRCPDGRSCKQEWGDVRDIAKGLALDADAAVGEAFTVGGLLTVWEELVPALAERLGVGYADVRMPPPNYFEFDQTKVRELLGYAPDHDFWSTLDAALAIRAGRETDVVPTGVRYGGAGSTGR